MCDLLCHRRRRLLTVLPSIALALWLAGCPAAGTNPDAAESGATTDGPAAASVPSGAIPASLEIPVVGEGNVTQELVGEFLRLTALPEPGWRFDRWSGTTTSHDNPLIIVPRSTTAIAATFVVVESIDEMPDTTSPVGDNDPGAGPAAVVDSDEDGVSEDADRCPGTAAQAMVDGDGCSAGQQDNDADGVPNEVDQCARTAAGDSADARGCSAAQIDTDRDGVFDNLDICASTAAGAIVDPNGCPVVAPPVCGNGVLESGEQCDPPNASTCGPNCRTITASGGFSDSCGAPSVISNGVTSFSNVGATRDGANEGGQCFFGPFAADIWFCYAAPLTGYITVNLCSSSFDSMLAVYNGCTCPATPIIACDDDGCGEIGRGSRVTVEVVSGQSYMIRVGGYDGETGGGTITIGPPGGEFASCTPDRGTCTVRAATPGCGDVPCCQSVCAFDAFCCTDAWDQECAVDAAFLCGEANAACTAESGSCTSAHATPGCNDVTCCSAICLAFPSCCDTAWDATCALYAQTCP